MSWWFLNLEQPKIDDGKIPDISSSQDPKHREVLTISNINLSTQKTQMTCLEMKRDEYGGLRELSALDDMDFPDQAIGSKTLNVLPSPTVLSTSILP